MEHISHRWVALVDLDAFFASVEVIENPELKGKPVLIGGSPDGRGVVAAASYEAREYGIHSAMPMAQALRRCPEAKILPARHQVYRDYSGRVMALLSEVTDVVQQVSIDEAYLELTPVASNMREAEELMRDLQGRVKDEIGLPCSVGLAGNKMVAKVACETGKPNGFVIVLPGNEAEFLAGLSVRRLPGIGPRSTERLNAQRFETLGQVASAPLHRLTALMGPRGAMLQRYAQGLDDSLLHTERETKSISYEQTFPIDTDQEGPLDECMVRMSIELGESLRRQGLVARTVTLKLRLADFTTITRSISRPNATASPEAIHDAGVKLLMANWTPGRLVRLVGIRVSTLWPRQRPGQLPLPALMQEGSA